MGKIKYTIEDMRKSAVIKNGKCLDEKYVNTAFKATWQCEKGHIWEAAFSSIKDGIWCPICSKKKKHTIEEMQQLAISKGGKCLSEKYINSNTKLDWECSCGNIFSKKPGEILNGNQWCPICGNKRKNAMRKLTINEMVRLAELKGGKCLSSVYENVDTKLSWQCASGHIWDARPHDIRKGSWCPYCAKSKYLTEEKCRYIFQKLLNKPFLKDRSRLENSLELDGYNNELKLAFEYQGIQHYKYEKNFHKSEKSLYIQIERDKRKRMLCKNKGIILIEIPYTVSENGDAELVNYIKNQFDVLKIKYISTKIDFVKLYSVISPLNELKKIAKNRGGECLSDIYVNAETKLKWRCKEGHEWLSTPASVKNNKHWCPICGNNQKMTLEQMQELAKQRNGKCLSSEYKNSRSKLLWECEKGHKFYKTPHHVKAMEQWCSKCSTRPKLTLEDVKQIAKDKKGECLSSEYKRTIDKLTWKCEHGHIFKMTIFNIKHNKQWCPVCNSRKSTIEQMNEIAEKRDGECLSSKYVNNKTKLRWKCSKNHEWEASPNNIKQGTWCPECNKINRKGNKNATRKLE